ncbi:hypothetical protein LZZ85_06245 [Terrimonas sp. NA20]|uniref:Uncharacterized protein n=1 Tax=Terrimonas ginsenosidimutans TaxID=2908004 RepID=A0ABS9KNI3_9BACT|nr:hypothetical protein [Terrimonas ginsenosidimutans]MCG2613871.1 hypothetical protein [Terrimonas ginsenosidimutans]
MLPILLLFLNSISLHDPPSQDKQLQPNEAVVVKVKANEAHNRTSVQLQKGQLYEITATGQWKDGTCAATDAAGFKASDCNSPQAGVDLGLSSMEALKRDKSSNWLCLTGSIYNQTSNSFENILPDQQFSIGRSAKIKPAVNGKLVLFANDIVSGYGNNTGQLTVTIKRIQ